MKVLFIYQYVVYNVLNLHCIDKQHCCILNAMLDHMWRGNTLSLIDLIQSYLATVWMFHPSMFCLWLIYNTVPNANTDLSYPKFCAALRKWLVSNRFYSVKEFLNKWTGPFIKKFFKYILSIYLSLEWGFSLWIAAVRWQWLREKYRYTATSW